MSAPEGEGWDGKFIKDHVEAAKNSAAEALDLARETADDLATLSAEIEHFRLTYNFPPGEIEAMNATYPPILGEKESEYFNSPSRIMGGPGIDKVYVIEREISAFSDFLKAAAHVRRAINCWKEMSTRVVGVDPND